MLGFKKAFLVLSLFLGAVSLRADVEQAKAEYQKGLDYMKAKNYGQASLAFQGALAAEPRYVYAWKQLGNCRYYQGDKAGALEAYDQYLAVIKNDPQTQAFADKLRGSVDTGSLPPPAYKAKPEEPMRRWRIGGTLGYHMLSFATYNADWQSLSVYMTSGSQVPKLTDAVSLGLVAGFRPVPKLELGLDLDYFLASVKWSSTSNYGGSLTSKTETTERFDTLWIGPRVSYDFLAKRKFRLGAQAGIGYMMLMGAGEESKTTYSWLSTAATSSATYSGSTIGFKTGLEALWRISPLFNVSFDLGYRLATMGTVAFTSKSTSTSGTTTTGSGNLKRFGVGASGDLPLEYSGVDFKAGANFCF